MAKKTSVKPIYPSTIERTTIDSPARYSENGSVIPNLAGGQPVTNRKKTPTNKIYRERKVAQRKAAAETKANTPRTRQKNISGKSGNIDRKTPVNKANTPDRIANKMTAILKSKK